MGRTFSAVPYTYLKRGVYYFVTALMMLTQPALAANFNQPKFEVGVPIFSNFYYGDSVGPLGCPWRDAPGSLEGIKLGLELEAVQKISNVVGFDWLAHHKKNSNSLNVSHDVISKPAKQFFALSQTAAVSSDLDLIKTAKKLAIEIAEAKTLANTTTFSDLKNNNCYGGKGNTKAECQFHAPQFAAQFVANYLVSVSLIWNHFEPNERDIIVNYADRMFKPFIKPLFDRLTADGKAFQQMANGGLGVLAYAFVKNDPKLAQATFKKIFKNMDQVFFDDGYIKGSSFRGVRGFWYHTYGVNSALAVIHLANVWKVNVPKKIYSRVVNGTRLINLGIQDLKRFEARENPDGREKNASYDPKDAIPHTHQMAIAIGTLAKIAVGVDLNVEDDPMYQIKVKGEYPSDFTIGFNPQCLKN